MLLDERVYLKVSSMGKYASIAIDSNDSIHIAYQDDADQTGGLRYATNQSGAWVTSAVDGDVDTDVGQFVSIAVDAENMVHLCYFDKTNGALKYATNASGGWSIETVDNDGKVGTHCSIAVDSNSAAHMSYYDETNEDLKYADNISGYWETTAIDTDGDVGRFSSMSIDSFNNIHIVYGKNTSDYPDGYIYLGYESVSHDIKYMTNQSGEWNACSIGSTIVISKDMGKVRLNSIANDSDNNVHVSYCDGQDNGLKYANNVGGEWAVQTIGTGAGYCNCMAIDNENSIHISFYEEDNSCLKYATNKNGDWEMTVVDDAMEEDQDIIDLRGTESISGFYNSIATDSSGNVHVSYSYEYGRNTYSTGKHYLKYANNSMPEYLLSGTWYLTTTDNWVAQEYCYAEENITGTIVIEQDGNNVTATFSDADGDITFTGMGSDSSCHLFGYSEETPDERIIPEAGVTWYGSGINYIDVDLVVVSNELATGTLNWLWEFDPDCSGGSDVTLSKEALEDDGEASDNDGGGGGGGCFIGTALLESKKD